MGGHSIVSQSGWEIDCKFLREMHYEEPDQVCLVTEEHDKVDNGCMRCGPGCHWSDLIKILNAYGKSPRTMQSYSSFSVGGTLAVNAHGITTDLCFAESVVEFRLARIGVEGKAEIVVCRPRAKDEDGEISLGGELFGLALGGYGLFGVITEILLKVEHNVQLELDTMQLNVQPSEGMHEEAQNSEFVKIYDFCRASNANRSTGLGKVEIKLARLNNVSLDKASLYVFRRSFSSATVSDLPASPRELSMFSRLLYKWAMPTLKDLRYSKEEKSGKALDWGKDHSSTRNQLLFESATPLSQLYNPLVIKDDTFVLQEFFCPHDKFSQWIDAAKPIYKDIEAQQKKYNYDLILLNTTIRYVEYDGTTFLSYSRIPGGVFAFVLYFRINRKEDTDNRLGDFHNRLADITVGMGGSFYLPYRKCYSPELLKAAYPMIERFAALKESMDPHCLFSNLWFEHYILPLCAPAYRMKYAGMKSRQEQIDNGQGCDGLSQNLSINKKLTILAEEEFWEKLPRKDQVNILRRNDSFRSLLQSKELRDQFQYQFLVQIFNVADPEEVMRVMVRAAWDPANQNDIHIYKYIHSHFHPTESNKKSINVAYLPRLWRMIQQLRQQKEELTRQTLSIISKLGMLGKIKNYVSMGDCGKTVKHYAKEFNISGKIWIVNDNVYPGDKLAPIEIVLERGSLDSVAHEEIAFDYTRDKPSERLDKIISGTIDLVTMNQGLHHIPLERLHGFLSEIMRILRPGGIFITREHDLRLEPVENLSSIKVRKVHTGVDGKVPYPILDLAHSVFNAIMGVSIEDEAKEIRAFRSILEWRAILENVGFEDSLIYDVEDGDPTWDEMICLHKPNALSNAEEILRTRSHEVVSETKILQERNDQPPIIDLINTFISQLPELVTSNISDCLHYLSIWLPKVQNKLSDLITIAIPYLITQNNIFGLESRTVAKQVGGILEPIITTYFGQALEFVNGCIDLLSESQLKTNFNFKNLIQKELYLILPYLQRKVQASEANEMEMNLISLLEKFFPSLFSRMKITKEKDRTSATTKVDKHKNDSVKLDEIRASEVQDFVEELADILPGILDAESMISQSGFTLPQQACLIRQFLGQDFSSTCALIAGYLDRSTWNELKKNLSTAVQSGSLPTKSMLLSSEQVDDHPWRSVLKTFLKSPKVKLNQQLIFGFRLVGLGDLGYLYREAKKKKEIEEAKPDLSDQYDSNVVSYLKSTVSSLEEIRKKWSNDIAEQTITYTRKENKETCLFDVAEVIEARFGYNSITSRKTDITKLLQMEHASIHRQISNPKYHGPVQIGFLPILESLLIEMRNEGDLRREFGDSVRKSVVNIGSLGKGGKNQLFIKYRRLGDQISSAKARIPVSFQSTSASGSFDSLQVLSKELCTFLESYDLLCADLHPNDGPYTWFKLNEWMQVEILDELVKSLEHTPWYRFPFMEFITTYFKVLLQQCKIVQEKYGFVTAYGSMSFLTDLIPGIVMAILFGQLQLLAIPLEKSLPNGYHNDRMRFLEDIVLYLPLDCNVIDDLDNYLKSTLDSRILNVKFLPSNFMICSVPPFKAMGEIIEKIAIRFPTARIFQISNQFEVQVRVSFDTSEIPKNKKNESNHADLQKLLSVPGVEQKVKFQYPTTHRGGGYEHPPNRNEKMKIHYCLEVHCLALLDVFRICSILPHHKVEQVYDFWN